VVQLSFVDPLSGEGTMSLPDAYLAALAAGLRRAVEETAFGPEAGSVGTVTSAGDDLVRLAGLADCMAGELLEVAPGRYGVALALEDTSVCCGLLDRVPRLRPGDAVRGTGLLPRLPCGPALLGRVVDPLGRPLDDPQAGRLGHRPVAAEGSWPLDFPGAGIAGRQPVSVPLFTGVKAVDALMRVGRGQCRPIVGGRRSGKTALALDAVLNQKDSGVVCVWVAAGQREAALAASVRGLREGGALAHTAVVAAGPADPPALRALAPLAGLALAEWFAYGQGRDTLVVCDDLTRAVQAHAELAALLRRVPGRDLYPADALSYLARLLERAAARVERWVIVPGETPGPPARAEDAVNGVVYSGPLEKWQAEAQLRSLTLPARLARVAGSGGSVTVLPIVEAGGEAADALAVDVLSLSDGPILLKADLFQAGVYPALDVGAAVALAGGGPGLPAIKFLLKGLVGSYLGMRELEEFAARGAELDRVSRTELERGRRVAAVLRQPVGRPLPPAEQVLVLYAGVFGHLDGVPPDQVREFEEGLRAHARAAHPGVLRALASGEVRSYDELRRRLGGVVGDFAARGFVCR
jgi:F-type H+-transporting ATPase subunit alpha